MSDLLSFRERLAEAGKKFDGHVTNGSLDAMMQLIARECVFMTERGYPIDLYNNCAECGGGAEGSIDHDPSCKHHDSQRS